MIFINLIECKRQCFRALPFIFPAAVNGSFPALGDILHHRPGLRFAAVFRRLFCALPGYVMFR